VGSWGIRAHESDTGCSLLTVATERYLRGVKFKTFHVRHVTEIMRSHIIDKFAKESNGWEAYYIDMFYKHTFHYDFAHALILVAECIAEYRQKGKYMVYDFAKKKPVKRRVAEFIFTKEDLETLRTELQSMLDPKHALYDSWVDSDTANKWLAHIQSLCDTLSQAIIGNRIYVRKGEGEIINRAKVHRMPSGRYAIKTNRFNGPFEVNINLPLFDTEAQAIEWLDTSDKWEADEGGDDGE
jgi:hypothetical protein